MSDPTRIALEIAYTTWDESCKDPLAEGLRECRRPHGHDGDHASGHGEGLRTWA